MADNGFTQKEMLQLVLNKLDDLEDKLENKLDKSEFYNGIGHSSYFHISCWLINDVMKAQVNISQVLQGGLAALVAWLFQTVNQLQSQVAVYMVQIQKLEENIVGLAMRERELNSALTDVLIKLRWLMIEFLIVMWLSVKKSKR